MNNKKFAYCTVITNDDYTPCIIRQKQRMDYLKCKYPFIVLVTDNVEDKVINKLKENNIEYRIVQYNYLKSTEKRNFYHHRNTINLFAALTLTDFDFIMVAEADMLFKNNFDFFIDYFYDKNKFKKNNLIFFTQTMKESKNLLLNMKFFFCRPNKKLFKSIIVYSNLLKTQADMDIINKLYFNSFSFLSDYELQYVDSNMLHFIGYPKIWNCLNNNFLMDFFYNYSYEEFNNIFDKISYNKLFDLKEYYYYITINLKRIEQEILKNEK